MKMNKAYKTELDPTREQEQLFWQYCGCVRFVWNWALGTRIEAYQERGESLRQQDLQSPLVAMKREEETAWLADVPSSALLACLLDQDRAMNAFFRRVKQGGAPGFPKFKARGISKPSFRVYAGARIDKKTGRMLHRGVYVVGRKICLPKVGPVRLKEKGYIPTREELDAMGGRIIAATISHRAGRWFVSCSVEYDGEAVAPRMSGPTLAIHPGVRVWASIMNESGEITHIENPRPLAGQERKLKRLQRQLSRKQKGSANRAKARDQLAGAHYRVAMQRTEAINQLAAKIVKMEPKEVILQAWSVKEMMEDELSEKPRVVAKAVHKGLADSALGQMIEHIARKCEESGVAVHVVPKEYPVSRRCPSCAEVGPASLSHTITCPSCGAKHDREHMACKNLHDWLASECAVL